MSRFDTALLVAPAADVFQRSGRGGLVVSVGVSRALFGATILAVKLHADGFSLHEVSRDPVDSLVALLLLLLRRLARISATTGGFGVLGFPDGVRLWRLLESGANVFEAGFDERPI